MNDYELKSLLNKYGTSLEETRKLVPKLTEAMRKMRAAKPPAFPQVPQFFTPREAKEYGVDLEPEWMLKLTPGSNGNEPNLSYITPAGWEITGDKYISPKGKTFTYEEFEKQFGAVTSMPPPVELGLGREKAGLEWKPPTVGREPIETEAPANIEQVFGKVFPEYDVDELVKYAETQPEAFYDDIQEIGRTPETEDLLTTMFPEITAEQLNEFFVPMAEKGLIEQAGAALGEAWKELTTGKFEWGELKRAGMATLGVAGAWLEKYVGRPWEVAILEANSRMNLANLPGAPKGTDIDREIISGIDEAFAKYGWAAIFSEDISNIWEESYKRIAPGQEWTRTFFEWTNPAYWIPIGSAFGLGAKFTSKIPILGRMTRATAAGVQAVERGITYPIAKPLELGVKYGVKGIEKVGVKLGEAAAKRIIKESEHLLLEIPESEALLKGVLVDNWMKKALTVAARVPILRGGIEKGLGWRILVKRESQAIEDIVGRSAVVHAEISRMGINARQIKIQELRAIEMNPIKLFGFNNKAYSSKMAQRLLPQYASEREIAGTLEHVFTKPEMYNWKGIERGLEYVSKVHEVNTEMLNLLKKEGVAPEHVSQDWWVHRVVEGKVNPEGELIELRGRPGVKGRGRIGAKPSFEMHRKAPTMAEGIAWGVQYSKNPELYVGSYIEEAFKKIADARMEKYVEPFGILPSERLAERFPEVVEKAAFTKTELADAAKFHSVINRAIRGERLPEQTLRATERRFPELGKKLRSLSQEPVSAEKGLREILAQNQRLIKNLETRLKKAEAIDIEAIKAETRAEVVRGIPDEQKLTEAFKIMDYEDRLAFRSTMESQVDDIGRLIYEQEQELIGLRELLATDPVATAKFTIGGRKVDLTSFISIRERSFPEYFTVKQAEALFPSHKFTNLTKAGRVSRDAALDDLTKQFNMSADEIADRVMQIVDNKQTLDNLRVLVDMAQARQTAIKRMLGILDNVDIKPEMIAKAEAGMPEAGMQQDIFGYQTPVFPKGKGQVTQLSMEDYKKLVESWKKAGLPEDALPVAIKPKIEGVKGLEAETQAVKVSYELPAIKSVAERKAALEGLRSEVKGLVEARKAPFWQAKSERAFRMEQVRQPGIGEGYIMQPFAGGRIYEQEFIDAFNKFFGHEKGLGVLKVTSDVAGILRITKAALDFSAMAIQGLPSWGLAHSYLLFNPRIGVKLTGAWYKAFFNSTRAFFDPGVVAGYIAKNRGIALQRIAMGGSSRAVDYFAALQVRSGIGGKAEWLMEHVPLKPYHRAETSFYSAGEMVRDEFWRILSPKAIAKGQEFELARILDRLTGIIDPASMGVPLTMRQLEQSFVWFAPSYTRACLTVLADIFRGGYTGAMAKKAIGGMIAAGAAMYSGVQYAIATVNGASDGDAWESVKEGFCVYEDPITGEVEWKPSARFMSLKIGNYNFGFGGFWYGLLRLGGNILACVNSVGEREPIDLLRIMKNGSFDKKDNPFIYWWFSRSSPLFGTGFELASGKDFLGYPIETPEEYLKYIATRFEPIWAEQGLNWMIPGLARDNEIPEGIARAALILAELFGLRTFPEGAWVSFYDKVNDYIKRIPVDELDDKQKEAWEEGKLEWGHLTEMQKANLLSRYPDLMELYGEAQADSAVRDSQNWKAWQGRIDEEREIYYERISDLTDQLIRGEIDTREYREKVGEAGQNYGSILEAIQRDPNYSQIYDFFDKKETEGDKYGFRDDIMLAEYQATILYASLLDSQGDYSWDERDRRVDAFIEKWGQEGYDRVQQYLQEEKRMKGVPEAWIRKSSDTEKLGRSYWRLPYKPFIGMDEEDEAEGNIPSEYYALWKEYQALTTDAEREAFIEKNPDLAKDWRAEYRRENPEDDARLAIWGYGGKLQSMEAYDLVTKWGRELGIPLEQMGLGLPPRSLINQYFEYAGITSKFSGNSSEARLFRLDNPEWDIWGQENWGWKPVEGDPELFRLRIKLRELEPDSAEYNKVNYQIQAYENEIPQHIVDTYVDWYMTERKDYEDDWFLMENKEFYGAMVDLGIWQERDFSKVPTKEVFNLYQEYLGKDKGTPRYDFRREHPELDDWLVLKFGYKPVSERAKKETTKEPEKEEKTPSEELEEVERFKELF